MGHKHRTIRQSGRRLQRDAVGTGVEGPRWRSACDVVVHTQAIGDETHQLAGRKSGGCPRHVKRAVRHTDVDRRRRNLEIDEKLVALRRRTVKKNTVRGQ